VNFSAERARAFLAAGLKPDILSGDLHGASHGGNPGTPRGLEPDDGQWLAWTLVGTMSKMLGLGMSLKEVVRGTTENPARALKLGGGRGTLSIGAVADVTILEQRSGDFRPMDSIGDEIPLASILLPTHTVKRGTVHRLDPLASPEFHNEMIEPLPAVRRSTSLYQTHLARRAGAPR
jgi:dihydroorotase